MAKGKKTGGRLPGTPNKKTQDLLSICEELKVDPFRAMLVRAQEIVDPKEAVDAWEKVCQYLYPKRKAIEVSGNLDVRAQQELDALMQLSDAEIESIIVRELGKDKK